MRFDPNHYPLDPGLRLLEASAGTGKTFALAHLALRLISEGAIPLSSLLVVTFTDAAAAELRSRIGQRLQVALTGLEALERGVALPEADPVLQQWWQRAPQGQSRRDWISRVLMAMEQLDAAEITTIHGFCSRSLRRLAISSGAAMQQQLETDATALVQEVVQDLWQQHVLTLPLPQLQGLMLAGLSSDGLSAALERLDGDPQARLQTDGDDFDPNQPLGAQLEVSLQASWRRFVSCWTRDGVELEQCFRSTALQWKAMGCKPSPYSPKPTTDRCAQVDRWIAAQGSTPDLCSIRAQQKLLHDYFHPGVWCRTARKCGEDEPSLAAPELQRAIADLWDGPIERVWRYALQRGLQQLQRRRQRSGTVSFAGLLTAMDPGDAEASWLEPLQQRYRAVMVDEFQDTDPVQWRLLQRSFGGGSHLLLLVGDPKQAIYRFRGGDLDTYRRARGLVSRIDTLEDNYRTTPPLMAGLNALMAPGLPESGLEVPAVQARTARPGAVLPDGQQPLQLLQFEQELPTGKTAIEAAVPPAVAEVVMQLLMEQPALSPDQLCILVSRHDQAADLRRALAERGVPTRLVAQGDVLDSDAALVLQRLLDALAAPADDRRLRLLAASPLVGWSADRLRCEAQDPQLDALAQRLRQAADQLPRLGLLGCLSGLLDAERTAGLSEQGRMLGDLQQAARLVQEEMHRQGLDLAAAALWLRRQRLHPPSPLPAAREPHSDLAESAVAVVTVHRSKGLEFPVVICPYLWAGAKEARYVTGPLWRDGAAGGWRIALNRDWDLGWMLWQRSHAEQVAEAERLAYVAVTRARSQLLLLWAPCVPQQSVLQHWLYEADAATLRDLPLSQRSLQQETGQQRWRPPQPEQTLAIGATPQRIDRSWGRSSYSAWIAAPAAEAVLEQGRDQDPEAEEATAAGSEEWPDQGPLADFPRGAAAGDCLHRMLEQLPFQRSADWGPLIEQELQRSGLPLDWCEVVEQGLQQVLETPLGGPLAALPLNALTPDRRLHELSFDLPVRHACTDDLVEAFRLDPQARFGGDYIEQLSGLQVNCRGFLTGSIDLVFSDAADPQQARWWVADWKSNWIGERGESGGPSCCGPRHYNQLAMEEQMRHHHYPLQAHLYLVALHRHLQWRLPGYEPERHLGGYVYVFLRGMPGQAPEGDRPGRIVEPAPLQRVLALDRMLQQGAV